MSSPAERAIQAVRRPLEFAAKDDFAHVGRLPELEKNVFAAASAAAELAVPKAVRDRLRKVRDAFRHTLSEEARRAAVAAALETLAPLDRPDLAARAMARPFLVGVGQQLHLFPYSHDGAKSHWSVAGSAA